MERMYDEDKQLLTAGSLRGELNVLYDVQVLPDVAQQSFFSLVWEAYKDKTLSKQGRRKNIAFYLT